MQGKLQGQGGRVNILREHVGFPNDWENCFPRPVPRLHTSRHDLPNGTPMLVTRGLACERHPCPRWFNPPEILAIDLR